MALINPFFENFIQALSIVVYKSLNGIRFYQLSSIIYKNIGKLISENLSCNRHEEMNCMFAFNQVV